MGNNLSIYQLVNNFLKIVSQYIHHIHVNENYSATKRNEVLIHAYMIESQNHQAKGKKGTTYGMSPFTQNFSNLMTLISFLLPL